MQSHLHDDIPRHLSASTAEEFMELHASSTAKPVAHVPVGCPYEAQGTLVMTPPPFPHEYRAIELSGVIAHVTRGNGRIVKLLSRAAAQTSRR